MQAIQLSPYHVLVLPLGWSGTWDVHETIRKVYVLVDCA
ncbi:cupin domain-containing protein [Micromonospora sonchi]|nr:cupin domain-containing protein [Micromonospora sonchi]